MLVYLTQSEVYINLNNIAFIKWDGDTQNTQASLRLYFIVPEDDGDKAPKFEPFYYLVDGPEAERLHAYLQTVVSNIV